MRVGVIGAGPSGLTTVKQLLDEGHDVVCFEKDAQIGGIWYRHNQDVDDMKVFDEMMLTISMKLMCYSDFMVQDRVFATRQEYLRYLEAYADKFGLRQHIRFNSIVEAIQKVEAGWQVTITRDGQKAEHIFEALAVCSGPFRTPNFKIPKLEKFTGEVIHSSRYRNNRKFRGKRVLVIGLAESGADIVRQISDVSAECTLSVRSHTFLVPRLFSGRYSTDTYTLRAHHYEMWVRATEIPFRMKSFFEDETMSRADFLQATRQYGMQAAMSRIASSVDLGLLAANLATAGPTEAITKALSDAALSVSADSGTAKARGERGEPLNNLGQSLYPLKLDLFAEASPEVVNFINEWNKKSHEGLGCWSPKIILCKNVTFVPNILSGKIQVNDSGIVDIDGKTVYFKDHAIKEYDTIVLCTGFEHDFSLLHGVKIPDNNVRNLFKHSIHPDYDGTLALMGFVRPFSGAIPICAEMQARYFALLCSKKLSLPENVRQKIQEDKEWEEKWTELSPRHFESIPSQIFFLDSIAKEIGCLPTCEELVSDPELLVWMWFHTFNQSCYRLTGPHSMPDEARKAIMKEKVPGEKLTSMFLFMASSLLPPHARPKDQILLQTPDGGCAPF
jgi:hypothetical protein